jgi:hypothetical protein
VARDDGLLVERYGSFYPTNDEGDPRRAVYRVYNRRTGLFVKRRPKNTGWEWNKRGTAWVGRHNLVRATKSGILRDRRLLGDPDVCVVVYRRRESVVGYGHALAEVSG